MTNAQTKIQKPQTKAQKCWSFYRQHMTVDLLTTNTDESKQKIREINKLCKSHFMSDVVGLSEKGSNTYIQICKDRMLGNDPHAGRKQANKNARLAKKSTVDNQSEVVAEQPVEETVDLSKRWVVGSSKTELVNSFDTRSQAQEFAKVNSLKWFDSKTI